MQVQWGEKNNLWKLFWIKEEQQRGDCHVVTSPRRDVTTSRRHQVTTSGQQISEVNNSPRRDVSTSRRHHVATSALKSAIIKCQRARKLGHGEACDGRHRIREQSNTVFKELLGFLYLLSLVLDIYESHDDVFHTI